MKKYPPVVVVDENDNEIGSAMLAEVWQKGLYHRIVSVFVLDEDNRHMLLQQRSSKVGIYPNCWDQAAGGHVDEGQTYDQAAHNEVKEEIGLTRFKLETVNTIRTNSVLADGRIINRFDRIYAVRIPKGTALEPEAAEVAKLQWFTAQELKDRFTKHPKQCTPDLLKLIANHFPMFYQ